MIKTRRIVPDYYYDESRDFQLIGRIYEGVLNHVKTATDCITNISSSHNLDPDLLDLSIKTLGFESKHEYGIENLNALSNSFKGIIRSKGSKGAIEDCVRVLLRAQNIDEKFEVIVDNTTTFGSEGTIYNRDVIVYVPKELKDISLLEDMLDYVLPTGYNFSIIVAVISGQSVGTEATSTDIVEYISDSSGQVNYSAEELGVVTPGIVEISENELDNATKGVLDNTVVVAPE